MHILRKVSDLKKGDRIIGNLAMPGPSSMRVVRVTSTAKTSTLVLDTFTGLGYLEMKLVPGDMVNVDIDKHKFVEK